MRILSQPAGGGIPLTLQRQILSSFLESCPLIVFAKSKLMSYTLKENTHVAFMVSPYSRWSVSSYLALVMSTVCLLPSHFSPLKIIVYFDKDAIEIIE